MADLEDFLTKLYKIRKRVKKLNGFIDNLITLFTEIEGVGDISPNSNIKIKDLIKWINEVFI